MLFDLAAWAVLILVAWAIGSGILAILGAGHLRAGDQWIIAVWLGVIVLSLGLLAASVVAPLTPRLTLPLAAALAALGRVAARRLTPVGAPPRPAWPEPTPAWAVAVGVALIAFGAAALASDPVTLYDSLVYHVGMIRWLHEHGTVPGVALIHNRLGHVSAWFTLGAAFDGATANGRMATVPLGLALVLVAGQAALGTARIAAGRARGADWFLALASAGLIWAVVAHNAATPSPDVAANALIVVVAWTMLVVPRAATSAHGHGVTGWFGPRLIPFVIAAGAATMKLFALPAVIAAAVFYVFARADDRGARDAARRAVVTVVVGTVLLAPFIAASLVASGCPAFPSSVGCLTTSWSVGAERAADYADYIRGVARWESRRSMEGASHLPWIGPWIATHPLLTILALLAPLLAPIFLRTPRRDGARSALLLAVLGIAFAAWQAPAPRFLYAFLLIVPALALAFPLASAGGDVLRPSRAPATRSRAAAGFLTSAAVAGLLYAVASQKVNVRSAVLSGASLVPPPVRGQLLVPAPPPPATRLYRWRVNDVEVLTPVPRPIADTLGYRSGIDGEIGFEKCSTAPLPCTPYLPTSDVRLRVPERGLAGGFARGGSRSDFSTSSVRCLGELDPPTIAPLTLQRQLSEHATVKPCGETVNGR